jgi:hypothetical protein
MVESCFGRAVCAPGRVEACRSTGRSEDYATVSFAQVGKCWCDLFSLSMEI